MSGPIGGFVGELGVRVGRGHRSSTAADEARAKLDIEIKAKEAWTSREEDVWGGL